MNDLVSIVKKHVTGEFNLPALPPGFKQFILIPVSSGIDSTATVLIMSALYPSMPFTCVMTDTGNEVKHTAESIAAIERVTGRKIIVLKPALSLLDRVKAYGGFIPSHRARWCTQVMKVDPFRAFIKQLKGLHGDKVQFISLVGIRADESSREGVQWDESNIISMYPLQALGIDKPKVNAIVNEAIGIPLYYGSKTRSGCSVCIYSRKSELISLKSSDRKSFDDFAATEKLPASYEAELRNLPPSVCEMTGTARNWLLLAKPEPLGGDYMGWMSNNNKRNSRVSAPLLGAESTMLYVAVEHHYNYVDIFGPKEVFFQKIITYSTSVGGIRTALKNHFVHRYLTKELWGHDSEAELADEFRVAIYTIELDVAMPARPEGMYTWHSSGTPLLEIEKVTYLAEQVLLTEGLRQEAYAGSVSARKKLDLVNHEYGRVLSVSLYMPQAYVELAEDPDITDGPIVCNACSR